MCTCFKFGACFGRTLDLETDLGQEAILTPNGTELGFSYQSRSKYGILGIALVKDDRPLYFDGVNSRGLAGAGLNFPSFAVYGEEKSGKTNLAPYEFLPYVLQNCADIRQAREAIENINIIDQDLSPSLRATPLHFMFCDDNGSIVAEQTSHGMKVYENRADVLTNSPDYPAQLLNLSNYMAVSASPPKNLLCPELELEPYSRGMGALGLPGDLSSQSRFVRGAFTVKNAVKGTQRENIRQTLHICNNVSQVKGCNRLENGEQVYTVYSVCYDLKYKSLYLSAYQSLSVLRFDMNRYPPSPRDFRLR